MRLINEHEVAMAIDRHTKPDGTLDDSIFSILSEIPTAFDRENVKKQMRIQANDWKDDWKPFLFLRDAMRIIDEGGVKQEG